MRWKLNERRRLWWTPAVLSVLLAGCNSEWMAARDRADLANVPPPPTYRSEIVAFMHTYLNDPIGVRDAYVSEPSLRTIDSTTSYMVCVRYDARKDGGRYAGPKDSLILFRNGRLDRIIDSARGQCREADYQPFPELQAMTR